MTYYELAKKIKNVEDAVNEINNLNDEYFEIVINHLEKLKKDRDKKKKEESYKKTEKPSVCPFCSNHYVILNGKQKGKQRFKCKSCGKTFMNNKITPVWNNSKKSIDQWESFMIMEMDNIPLRTSAKRLDLSLSTAFAWRHKILKSIREYYELNSTFFGKVQVDETYLPFNTKGNKRACNNLNKGYAKNYQSEYLSLRESGKLHKRGKSIHKAGLSNEQVCIPLAIGSYTQSSYGKSTNFGKPNTENIADAFFDYFSSDIVMITDKEKSSRRFAEDYEIPLIQVSNNKLSLMKNETLNNINNLHSLIKEAIRKYKGVSTKHLDYYLFLFIFKKLNANLTSDERIKLLKEILLKGKENLRYKDLNDRKYPAFVYGKKEKLSKEIELAANCPF